jgi:hypothetical protein
LRRSISALEELVRNALVSISQGTTAIIRVHRVIQQVVIDDLQGDGKTPASDETWVSFQRAVDFVGRAMPSTTAIKTSSVQDLKKMEWCLAHSEFLATRYGQLHLRPSLDWAALILDSAGLAARLGGWILTKRLVVVANSMLGSLTCAGDSLDDDRLNDLQKRGETMRAFLDEWGF